PVKTEYSHTEHVTPEIPAKKHSVPVVQSKINFRGQVIEIKVSLFERVRRFKKRFYKSIHITAPQSHNKTCLVFDERTLNAQATKDCADTTRYCKLFTVPVFHPYVQDRRNTSPVLSRNSTLDQLYIFYSVGIKYRKKSKK